MRLLLFIFLFLNLNAFGQVKLLNLDLTVPDTNIFYDAYFKMPNHFEIKGITAVDYKVKIKEGKGYDLILSSKNRFELYFWELPPESFLIDITDMNDSILFSKKYNVVRYREPQLNILNDSLIRNIDELDSIYFQKDKNSLFKYNYLEGFDLFNTDSIISFNAKIQKLQCDDDYVIQYKKGEIISDSLKSLIKSLNSNFQIVIFNSSLKLNDHKILLPTIAYAHFDKLSDIDFNGPKFKRYLPKKHQLKCSIIRQEKGKKDINEYSIHYNSDYKIVYQYIGGTEYFYDYKDTLLTSSYFIHHYGKDTNVTLYSYKNNLLINTKNFQFEYNSPNSIISGSFASKKLGSKSYWYQISETENKYNSKGQLTFVAKKTDNASCKYTYDSLNRLDSIIEKKYGVITTVTLFEYQKSKQIKYKYNYNCGILDTLNHSKDVKIFNNKSQLIELRRYNNGILFYSEKITYKMDDFIGKKEIFNTDNDVLNYTLVYKYHR